MTIGTANAYKRADNMNLKLLAGFLAILLIAVSIWFSVDHYVMADAIDKCKTIIGSNNIQIDEVSSKIRATKQQVLTPAFIVSQMNYDFLKTQVNLLDYPFPITGCFSN